MPNWGEVQGYAYKQGHKIIIRLPHTSREGEYIYYYQTSRSFVETNPGLKGITFSTEIGPAYFTRLHSKTHSIVYNYIRDNYGDHWGWFVQRVRSNGTKRWIQYCHVDRDHQRTLPGFSSPCAVEFNEETLKADPQALTRNSIPVPPDEGTLNIQTLITDFAPSGTKSTPPTPTSALPQRPRFSSPNLPEPTPSTSRDPPSPPRIRPPEITPPGPPFIQSVAGNTGLLDNTPLVLPPASELTMAAPLGNLESLMRSAAALQPTNFVPVTTDDRDSLPTHSMNTLHRLTDDKVGRLGGILADMDNLYHAITRNIVNLMDNRPPVLPIGQSFQSPLPELLTQGLADRLNAHMMECARKCSMELIQAQIRHQESLARQQREILASWSPTEQDEAAINEIRRLRAQNRTPFTSKGRIDGDIKFFTPPQPGTREVKMLATDQPRFIHSTGYRPQGNQNRSSPPPRFRSRSRSRPPPRYDNTYGRRELNQRYSRNLRDPSSDRDYDGDSRGNYNRYRSENF